MAKQIDISSKLTNARPTLKLAEDKVYEINNSKNTVLQLDELMSSESADDPAAGMEKMLVMLLGDKAVAEIEEMELSFEGYQYILMAALAGATGEEIEAVEARFQRERANV